MSDDSRVRCVFCDGLIELLDDGASRWWVHDNHPADGHDAKSLTHETEGNDHD